MLGVSYFRLARACKLAAAGFCVLMVVAAASARAAGPNAVESLPGCTATQFAANDDGSVQAPLGFTANFYGNSFTNVSVNNNGNVTFGQALSTYTPFDFTTTGNIIIAPYLADVDTRGGAPNTPVTYGSGVLGDGTKYFCVNWVNVGYYFEHSDKLNSFQLLLTQSPAEAASGGNFTITFNYDQIQWETGDASGGHNGFGGTPAAVGFSASDGVNGHQYMMPGSFTSMSFEDSNGSTGLINNSLNSGGQLGRYVFPVVNGPVSGGTVTGRVLASGGGGTFSNAPVDICPTGGGACFTRSTNTSGVYRAGGVPPGTYNVTGYPPSGDDSAPATVGPETVTDGQTTNADVTLGPSAQAPPDGTTLTGLGPNPDGIPVINWSQSGTLTTLACGGALLNWTMTVNGRQIAGGPMTQTSPTNAVDGSATYQATYPAVEPNHGNAHIAITGTCPVGGSQVDDEFDIYIDPSGTVTNTLGTPIAGATVTLLRSASPAGPFIQVPNGSAEMSPANRVNPDTSGSDGSFGWDVVGGYYEIQATKAGCFSPANHSNPVATSPALTIPPPATNLTVAMWCGESAPAPTPTPAPAPAPAPAPVATPTGPTAAGVLATVASSLSSHLNSLVAQLKSELSVLGVKSFTVPFTAVSPGVLSITIKTVPAGNAAAAAKKKHKPKPKPKPITVASGQVTITGTGTAQVVIRTTAAGRAALAQAAKTHKPLKLKLFESFTPSLNGHALSTVQPTANFGVLPHPAKKHKKHK